MTFQELINNEGVAEWIRTLEHQTLGPIFKPWFAHLEIWHIVSLFMIGGTLLLTNLRLLGVGLTSEPPSVIEKNTRLWLNIGVFGVLASGVLIGFANAEKLYGSPAFTVKMVGLLAAIIFTYVVCLPTARNEGRAGPVARLGAVLAIAIWLAALWVFCTVVGLTPGIYLVIIAAAMMVWAVLKGRARWVYLIGLALLLIAHQIVTHFVVTPETNYDGWVAAAKGFVIAEGIYVLGFAAYHVLGFRNELASGPFTRLVAFSTFLVWVTVAAAGRWIAFAS